MKGPGLVLLIPVLQELVRVDLRTQVIEIPTQDVISRNNVLMKVDAVLYSMSSRKPASANGALGMPLNKDAGLTMSNGNAGVEK